MADPAHEDELRVPDDQPPRANSAPSLHPGHIPFNHQYNWDFSISPFQYIPGQGPPHYWVQGPPARGPPGRGPPGRGPPGRGPPGRGPPGRGPPGRGPPGRGRGSPEGPGEPEESESTAWSVEESYWINHLQWSHHHQLSLYDLHFDSMNRRLDEYHAHMGAQHAQLVAWEAKGAIQQDLDRKCASDITPLRSQLDEQRSRAEDLPHEDAGLHARINRVEEELTKQKFLTESLSTSNRSTITALNDIISTLRMEIKTMTEKQTMTQATVQKHIATIAALESTVSTLRLELRTEVSRNKANTARQTLDTAKQTLEYNEEVYRLQLDIAALQLELRNVEKLTVFSDPICMWKIRIRTLMDVFIQFLHEAVTGIPIDDRLPTANIWWRDLLNPPSSREERRFMDKASIDRQRYEECLKLLSAAGLSTRLPYKQLIDSGTLKFIIQGGVDLRRQANVHAHELLDMSEFRRVLSKAKLAAEKIWTVQEFAGIGGLVDFVELMQGKT